MTTLTNGLFSMAAKCSTGLLLVALMGCGQPTAEGPIEPLLDDRHLPDVLVESRAIELPPALGGNRFLRGWFPWRSQGQSVWCQTLTALGYLD